MGQKRKLVQRVTGKKEGSILDIGCGTGDFLKMMKDSNWKTLGLEPDDRARKIALEKNGIQTQATSTLFDLEENRFDAISMWHVLEHVHELHAYLEQIKTILKNNGALIIAVPNFQSSDAQHYQDLWAAYDVPRHLYHFSPNSIEVLLNQHGFSLTDTKSMPFDSFYVSLLSEKYKHGKLKLVPGFWNGFVSYLNSIGTAEKCSSVLYIAKPKS